MFAIDSNLLFGMLMLTNIFTGLLALKYYTLYILDSTNDKGAKDGKRWSFLYKWYRGNKDVK